MKNTLITGLYFLIATLFIIFGGAEGQFLKIINKALIIPVLVALVMLNRKEKGKPQLSETLILSALFFSFAGDVALELTVYSDMAFIAGLGCFLLAHLFYIALFLRTPGENFIKGKNMLFVVPVIAYGIVLVLILSKHLGTMFVPVLLYTAVILMMVTAAINRKFKVGTASYIVVFSGAVLFVISDSLIALDRFVCNFRFAGIAIMATYVIAQYLIVKGYLLQIEKTETAVR
jgi:uncharacterized membrane protein YhhN